MARRVDEVAIAEIDADVRERAVARVVEDEVARQELRALDRVSNMALPVGASRQGHAPGALVDVRDEPAAIESGLRRGAAVVIRHADGMARL